MKKFKLKLVQQEDWCGCGIACIAMLLGCTYRDARAAWLRWGASEDALKNGAGINGDKMRAFAEWLGVPASRFSWLHMIWVDRIQNWHWVVISPKGRKFDPLS